jgi:hypothetical protein
LIFKYFFKEKNNNILERDFEKKYKIKNRNYEHEVWKIYNVFITHKLSFYIKEGLKYDFVLIVLNRKNISNIYIYILMMNKYLLHKY